MTGFELWPMVSEVTALPTEPQSLPLEPFLFRVKISRKSSPKSFIKLTPIASS